MSDLDDMIEFSEKLNTGTKTYTKFEKCVLTGSSASVRGRLVGKFKQFFESWVKQQAVPGVKVESYGKPRRIVSAGFRQLEDRSYEYLCPFAKAVDMLSATTQDSEKKKLYDDWKVKRFFAYNFIPVGTVDGKVDPWCEANKNAKLITTNASNYGIGPKLFKAIADAMKVYRGYFPDARLDQVDVVLTRTGEGLGTNYGCQVCPVNSNIDITQYKLYDFDEFTTLTPLNMIQLYTGIHLGVDPVAPKAQEEPIYVVATQPAITQSQAVQPLSVAPHVAQAPTPTPIQTTPPVQTPIVPHVPAAPQVATLTNTPTPAPTLVPTPVKVAAPAPVQSSEEACPHCTKILAIPETLKGCEVKCPACGNNFITIPF